MYKLDLPIDFKEALIIENRRNREEQRKSNIFNSKNRQIGIDVRALEQQIKEKETREKIQNDQDILYAAAANRADKIAILLEHRQKDDLKEINRILNEFRLEFQKPEQRREYDLYDPNGLKNDKPARVSDDDPRCGISSIQKFDGEDLNNKYRMTAQRDQMQKWLKLQIDEKQKMLNSLKQSQRLYDLKQIELDRRACDLMEAEEECRKAINAATSNYNEALYHERLTKEKLKSQHDDDDKKTHMVNAIMSDLLTENPNQAISALGCQRIIPDRYKGMSKDQLQSIYDMQIQQINDKKLKAQQEKQLNDLMDKERILQDRTALLIENEIMRKKQFLDKSYAEENIKLSKRHQEMMDYINKEVYTNQPTAAYFTQFNTCSR